MIDMQNSLISDIASWTATLLYNPQLTFSSWRLDNCKTFLYFADYNPLDLDNGS